ncbi:MAG: hypothetical protein ABI378_12660 [Chitinophagaceae bacterium]
MKPIYLLLLLLAFSISSRAQLVFRNIGKDTLRIAVATFYDTSQKAMSAAEGKSVIVKGWYKLLSGDSLNYGAFFGPAVYYTKEIIRNNHIIGDFVGTTGHNIRDFREHFYVDVSRALTDTTKFKIKHPYMPISGGIKVATGFFRTVLVPSEAKKTHGLVVELGKALKG